MNIKNVKLFTLKNYNDDRGSFSEIFLTNINNYEFSLNYVQENESISKQLNNKKFISKAPQELVKKQMGRNKEISKELKLLDIQIKEIQKLL